MKKMARYDNWITSISFFIVLILLTETVNSVKSSNEILTACQHLRKAESRRAKALVEETGTKIRIPKCSKIGDFEPIQCSNEINGTECWCVDEYGTEITGTRRDDENDVNCAAPSHCQASSCRMFCPSGFSQDLKTGCPICQCRDPCEGVQCPGGLACQPQEVKCKAEPCPPIPTCKRARSLTDLCPAGQPLAITDTIRPFLCGNDAGKPSCPPLYKCLVQSGNDYGVCCPASLQIVKPGTCPKPDDIQSSDQTGVLCGAPCEHDLECPQMEKCCQSNGCNTNCQQPFNVTTCHQAKVLSEILSVNEREGRGYIPQCDGPGGVFSTKQCSRNGLVCWCVDPKSGNKVKGTMGAAIMVNCDGIENMIGRAIGRSVDGGKCDRNICAAVCEYGFKNDHNDCPTCECSEPCEGFKCSMGSHCEVARDSECISGSSLCASEPICKPDLVYSNPCDIGTPLADNTTGEVFYCQQEAAQSSEFQSKSFFDTDLQEITGRALTNFIVCPNDYQCINLHKESGNVCCPSGQETTLVEETTTERQQSMCEYLRDFADKMEGTEDGMAVALAPPKCLADGGFEAVQCSIKTKKVTKSEQKRLIEQKNIRQMRRLLTDSSNVRIRRDIQENLKLIKVQEDSLRDQKQLNVQNVVDFLKQKILNPTSNSEEAFLSELLASGVLGQGDLQGRSAKIIEFGNSRNHYKNDKVKSSTKPMIEDDLVDAEVEECWCVDNFGTEIPRTKSVNTSQETCQKLRESLECLDLTCRMGCDYGFILDPVTQCPDCECRDPCSNVECGMGQECRTVEVSCDGDYCPPVPACLPRKPGQCPFLIPPGVDGSDSCDYECRSDSHCDGNKRCCSNGCGTQCVEPELKTACQHLQAIQLHQSIELGVPAKQKYIAQCSEDGTWKSIQCGPGEICWCVDESGNEKSGTRSTNRKPDCDNTITKNECPMRKCRPCDHGYVLDSNGCRTCECREPCKEISCPGGEECQLVQVECIDAPCPKMAICVPHRDSLCTEGNPLKLNGKEISCGPQSEENLCPTTHSCQLNPIDNKGVCCGKTRDVCFESFDENCMKLFKTPDNSSETITKWRFSPRHNKCVSVTSTKAFNSSCQNKNIFHSEAACEAVCPVLSQCERLRLKNSLAAKKSTQKTGWFQPKCDTETGTWSPVQCLGNPEEARSLDLSMGETMQSTNLGVCWCADKKGAPMKGSLTRGVEPVCNHRQARRRMSSGEESVQDPVMEELIRQMTVLVDDDDDNFIDDFEDVEQPIKAELVLLKEQKLVASSTRCNALMMTAPFPVSCDENGAFKSTQCNGEICWCVDAAGNQLPMSSTFRIGSNKCVYTPIDSVEIELHLKNEEKKPLNNIHSVLKEEMIRLLGNHPENLRIHENFDGNVVLKFELTDENKIDTAFALEEMVKQRNLFLYQGILQPDITLSRFLHRNTNLPVPQSASGIPESTFQTVVFILATGSAFLISIFVVFVMLKRGRNKMKNYPNNKTIGMGDKFIDYSSPIFVLSANEKEKVNKDIDVEK